MSSIMIARAPGIFCSRKRIGQGLNMSNRRNNMKPIPYKKRSGGINAKVNHWPATSSTTTQPGSLWASEVACAANHPKMKTISTAIKRPDEPQAVAITQANGSAAAEPTVPGALAL